MKELGFINLSDDFGVVTGLGSRPEQRAEHVDSMLHTETHTISGRKASDRSFGCAVERAEAVFRCDGVLLVCGLGRRIIGRIQQFGQAFRVVAGSGVRVRF